MSGQDFSTLLRAGYRPAGLVMGNCVYHVARQGMMQSLRQIGRNTEMPNFTQALYEARELAMERMQNEADELQSEGIVGARIIERSHGWGSHVIEFFAIGTAVVSTSPDHQIEKPALVLPAPGVVAGAGPPPPVGHPAPADLRRAGHPAPAHLRRAGHPPHPLTRHRA